MSAALAAAVPAWSLVVPEDRPRAGVVTAGHHLVAPWAGAWPLGDFCASARWHVGCSAWAPAGAQSALKPLQGSV